jgi:hypothetical protein
MEITGGRFITMINLGDKVKDAVAGFTGIVLARMECLYEATQCRVHPDSLDEEGRIKGCEWFEEDRLIVLGEHVVVGFKEIAGKKVDA